MRSKLLIALVAIATLMINQSCVDADYYPCLRPVGPQYEETRLTGNFNSINLSTHANVYVEYGRTNSVVIVAADNMLDNVTTQVSGSTLYIDNSRCLRTKTGDISIYITTPEIKMLKVSGSGNIYVDDDFGGTKVSLEITGSGNIEFPEAFYARVQSTISGSGSLRLGGVAADHQVVVSGSGRVRAFNLDAESTSIRISGSGDARVRVFRFLDARISGSGNIYYKGNPMLSVAISGSGAIFKAREDAVD